MMLTQSIYQNRETIRISRRDFEDYIEQAREPLISGMREAVDLINNRKYTDAAMLLLNLRTKAI